MVSSCPSNITVPFGLDTANWTEPSATDNSGQAVGVARSHRPGQTFPEGPTLVAYTFTDVSGNQANCVFFVVRLRGGFKSGTWSQAAGQDSGRALPEGQRG